MEVVADDSRPYFRASRLERAEQVGQVCGSSPDGPTIVFNHLAENTRKLHL